MYLRLLLAFSLTFLIASPVHSQSLLKRIQKQAEDKALKKTDEALDDALFGNGKNESNPNSGTNSGGNTGDSGYTGTANTTGGGLISEPPDVLANINDASQAFNVKNYGTSRHALRQAMVGIEMEMGQNILNNLPKNVDGLSANPDLDKVTSVSFGFVGLTMQRVYQGGNKELKVSLGNNSGLLSAANMMLTSSAYATSSNDQNYKQVTFKGYRSVLQYDDGSGYTLSVPFGQSSIMVVNGRNYDNEKSLMQAAEVFDIESIKAELGEK